MKTANMWARASSAPAPVGAILVALIAIAGPTASIAAGFDAHYAARVGDLNGDGRKDIYLEYRPPIVFVDVGDIATPIATARREVAEFVLLNNGNGTFTITSSLTAADLSAVRQWPISNIKLSARDVNADGLVDLGLGGVSQALTQTANEIDDQIVYSPTQQNSAPTTLRGIDANLTQFATELDQWIVDPNYFYNNAPITTGQITGWFTLSSLIAGGVTINGLAIVDDPLGQTAPSFCVPNGCLFGVDGWEVYITLTWQSRDYSQFSLAVLIAGRFGSEGRIPYGNATSVATGAQTVVAVMDYMLETRYSRLQSSLPLVTIPIPVPAPTGKGVNVDEDGLGYLILGALWELAQLLRDLDRLNDRFGVYFHNSTEPGCAGIQSSGWIDVSATTGLIFLTPQLFPDAAQARKSLALSYTPYCYFVVKGEWTNDLFGPFPVGSNNGEPGGGIQYTTAHPIFLPNGYRKFIPYYRGP